VRRFFRLQSELFQLINQTARLIPARRARPAPWAFNLWKTLVQSALMWLLFLGVLPLIVREVESWFLEHGWPLRRFKAPAQFAAMLFVGGWMVAWSSAWVLVRYGDGTPLPLDATNNFVVRGPYRWVRNPMAFASLLQGSAVGLALGSPLVLFYVLCGAWMWNFGARLWEEADLEERHGDDYRAYKAAVSCWLPRLRPYPRRDE